MGNRPGFFGRIMRALSDGHAAQASSQEELRALFRARSQAFTRLLEANNKALEIMGDLEEALKGGTIFGMSFVRASATAVGVNVFKLVHALAELEPGRHETLFSRLAAIQAGVDEILSRRAPRPECPLVLPFSEIDRRAADLAGGKMANLADMRTRLRLPVPDGFVVTAAGYEVFMAAGGLQAEINARLQSLPVETDQGDASEATSAGSRVSADIQRRIMDATVPEELAAAITGAYARLCAGAGGRPARVSLRSSALGEDAAGATFAGQFKSLLNVPPEQLLSAYKEVVASKHSPQAMAYRLNRGIRDEDVAMCVGCMLLVDARAGGVMYSRNPLDVRDPAVFINAVWGLPTAVVDGSAPTDLFVVERAGGHGTGGFTLRERTIKRKTERSVPDLDTGLRREPVEEALAAEASLTDVQVFELARLADVLEEAYGGPQDIEWAVDQEGRMLLLQCRPLKRVVQQADVAPAGRAVGGARELFSGGTTASSGMGAGPVFVVLRESDALRFPKGGVLVTPLALPRWAAPLARASALVTEQGGLAGHLANVAREFGVPALFDVPGASTRFTEGETVTVDALGRRVYQGRVEELLAGAAPQAPVMLGSQVFETLREVAKLILPLNLTDPDAADFRPESCASYHDITRYAHEMSLRGMFDFGTERGLPSQASKQLLCKVPMQWWVVNLDDGFAREVPERFVGLADIVSAPMLAIWEGITAVPWSGPPSAGSAGLVNVFLEASMNPELAEGATTGFSERNVFLISKRYACLNSRFGFHFTTIEALLAGGGFDSYAGFKFSGGAADEGRRNLRAALIADVLEQFGFQAKLRGDTLFAKTESQHHAFILDRLRILGYLLVHTRQLDMAMTGQGVADALRTKFLTDIGDMLAKPFKPPLPVRGGLA